LADFASGECGEEAENLANEKGEESASDEIIDIR
jgi:hypothetical protein